MTGRLARPSKDLVANSVFGPRGTAFHFGTDWGWGSGDNVYAMADGIISEVKTLTDYGKIVRINHRGLIDGKKTETRYCHLASFAKEITTGKEVKRGDLLGVMGSTGTLTDLKHLHSELWLNGVRVDEQPYQKENYTMPTATRTVKPTNANRRTTPTVAANNLDPSNLTFNTAYPIIGYRTDLDPTKVLSDTNKWFLVDKDGKKLYSHASGFTDSSTTGITSLDPVTPPPTTVPATKADLDAMQKVILDAIPTESEIAAEVIRQMQLPGN